MHNYKKLIVWQDSIKIVEAIYEITRKFPDYEKFGLVSQMQRSATSIASNIAEGAGRNSDKDFVNFLSMALGSAYELGTQMVIANRIGYIEESKLNTIEIQLEIIQKQIYKLQESLKK